MTKTFPSWSFPKKLLVTIKLLSWMILITPFKAMIYGIGHFFLCWLEDWNHNLGNLIFMWRNLK